MEPCLGCLAREESTGESLASCRAVGATGTRFAPCSAEGRRRAMRNLRAPQVSSVVSRDAGHM